MWSTHFFQNSLFGVLPPWNQKEVLSRLTSQGTMIIDKHMIGRILKLFTVLFSGRGEEKEQGLLKILLK